MQVARSLHGWVVFSRVDLMIERLFLQWLHEPLLDQCQFLGGLSVPGHRQQCYRLHSCLHSQSQSLLPDGSAFRAPSF
jgi:hypothetical protein